MATYTVDLTPTVVTQASEASLDTSVLNGLSLQRTKESLLVVNGSNRKQLYRLADGETYDDTNFETVVHDVPAGNSNFDAGMPVIEEDNVTSGHPTANSNSGSTL
jgi:hypothetical protein